MFRGVPVAPRVPNGRADLMRRRRRLLGQSPEWWTGCGKAAAGYGEADRRGAARSSGDKIRVLHDLERGPSPIHKPCCAAVRGDEAQWVIRRASSRNARNVGFEGAGPSQLPAAFRG